jgi:hypothetical protein
VVEVHFAAGRAGGNGVAAECEHELRHQPLGIQAEILPVLPHKGAREDAAGEDVDAVLFEGPEETDADLRRLRHVVEVDAAQLPFPAEVFTEGSHVDGVRDPEGESASPRAKIRDDCSRRAETVSKACI